MHRICSFKELWNQRMTSCRRQFDKDLFITDCGHCCRMQAIQYYQMHYPGSHRKHFPDFQSVFLHTRQHLMSKAI